MSDPTDAAAVFDLIAQLEAERDELNAHIAFLRRRANMPPATDAQGVERSVAVRDGLQGRDTAVIVGRVRPDEFFRLSTSDAIMKYLGIMKQPQSPTAVMNGLKSGGVLTNAKNFYANVHTELKRMQARGLVVSTPSGWGLSEWYPQKPKQNETQKSKTKAKKRAKAKAAKPKAEVPATSHATKQGADAGPKRTEYNTFVAERRAAGLSLAQAAAEWTARKSREIKN